MTPEALRVLEGEIEMAVRCAPGVWNVYRSGSLIAHLLRAGTAAIGQQKDKESIVSVAWMHGGIVVEASIGVDLSAPAGQTLRTVHETIDDLLQTKGLRRRGITLSIAYVHWHEAPDIERAR
jgi:hypothetical protein